MMEVFFHLQADEPLVAKGHHDIVSVKIGSEYPGPRVTFFLPTDDTAALVLLDRLAAVLDNAVSAVRLREQEREAASAGPLGAGGSVEAYRG